ncbi:hypothetical protein RvY_13174-2 [Ramazzottius varieornatus]|nr:hypothetical protein RvY_13174-2 [Ramazzottius varieornatus]
MYVAGVVAQNHGWEAIFYCFGALCLVWVVLWMLLAHNTPNLHPRISVEERDYINSSFQTGATVSSRKKKVVPWLAICTSAPVCALLLVEIFHSYAFYVIISNMPTYLNNIHRFSLKSNGLLSAMPYLVRWMVTLVVVSTTDWILTRKFCSATVLRKSMSLCAFIGCGLSLLGVAFSGCNSVLVVALFTVGVGFSGLNYGGYLVAYFEMSPNYASILLGMGNTAGTISGIVAPYITGVLTNGPNAYSVANWQTVFLIPSGLYAGASVVYGVFATAKRQIWD